jgi:sugar phosphate permease
VTNANVIIFLLALQGLCGAEIVGRRSVGASEGFLGWVAYLVRHNTVIYKSKIEKAH